MRHPPNGLPAPPRSDAKLTIGWIEQTAHNGGALSPEDRAILDRYIADDPGALLIASKAYHAWLKEHAADFGYTHQTTTRWTPDRGYISTTRRLRPSHVSQRAPRQRERRPRVARRTASSSSTSGSDPSDLDSAGADPWPGGFTFRAFDALVSVALPGHVRLRLFDALPERWQREAWDSLSDEIARAAVAA